VLAAPLAAPGPVPPEAVALRDGWAVAASDVVGTSSYSPVMAAAPPPWVETGRALPPGTDAVLPPDGIAVQGGLSEIVAAAAPGEGVRPAGGDAAAGAPLREAGERVRPVDAALALAAGVDRLRVCEARVRLLSLPGAGGGDATSELVARLLEAAGAVVTRARPASRDAAAVAAALRDADADLLVTIGGTGFGREDHAAEALAAAGSLIAHGIALRPGETAGCGLIGETAAILVPGRFDAALAVMLCLVLPCLDHLAGAAPLRPTLSGPLTRKISSTVGLTEIALVRRSRGGLEPLAVADLTLTSLAAAEGWLAVPAGSEGFAVGDTVAAFSL
jgi:molybdopterin biosynthesis enzyme